MQNLEMHKVLRIKNFGIYYKTNERNLIANITNSDIDEQTEERGSMLQMYAKYNEESSPRAGCIMKHEDDYLISPIQLDVKLTQREPDTALANRSCLMNLSVELRNFCITV